MITPEDKNLIITELGKQYTTVIIEYLNQRKIFNTKGNPYSRTSIRNIMCGKRKNRIIKRALFDLIVRRKDIAIALLKYQITLLREEVKRNKQNQS